MLRLTCSNCNNEVVVSPYFHRSTIITEEDPSQCWRTYIAKVDGNFVCPQCGMMKTQTFQCPILTSDVIDLALRREVHV